MICYWLFGFFLVSAFSFDWIFLNPCHLKRFQENEVIFKSRISELELSLHDAQAVLKTKDNRIQCLEKKEEDLNAKVIANTKLLTEL
jgi:predicted double-glycine peptidase